MGDLHLLFFASFPGALSYGSIAVILDAARTRRLDVNERTWKLASNAASIIPTLPHTATPSGRTLSAGVGENPALINCSTDAD